MMIKCISFFFVFISNLVFAQHSLTEFIQLALDHSPVLKDYQYRTEIGLIQQEINHAENAAFHLSLTGDYLFVPYFNNNGDLVTTNPSPEAIGYDINLFDGGLYSAQVNLERNIFNGRVIDILDRQIHIQNQNSGYYSNLEKHSLKNQVTNQYLNAYQNLLLTRLSETLVSNLSEQLKLTADLTENGFAKPQDYLLLKIELKTQEINLRNARQNYRSNLYRLYTLCGIRDTSVVDLDPVTLTIEHPPTESMFIRKFFLDSLQTVNEQELFELKYVPQVHLFMNAGLNAVELNNIQRKFGLSAGLSLSLPLYDGRQKSLTRQKSYVAQNTIQSYRHFTDRTIDMQRQELFVQIDALKKNIIDYNQQIADYNHLLALSEKQLQQGNTSMMEHLILLRNFTEIRKNKIETEVNYQIQINNYNYWNW